MAADEVPLAESAALKLHASLVMRTVGSAVAGLRDITSLVPTLVQLAERHSDFRVLPEHFPVVGEALLWTLEKGLGGKWTREVKAAWEEVWSTIVSVMAPALAHAYFAKVRLSFVYFVWPLFSFGITLKFEVVYG